ncbi:hypothetical protein D3C78_1683410 [compost metagenome]
MLAGITHGVSVRLAVCITVILRRFGDRHVKQAHQLPGIYLPAISPDITFHINLTGTEGHRPPALDIPVAAVFCPLDLAHAVEERISRISHRLTVTALADFIQRHKSIVVCSCFVHQPERR